MSQALVHTELAHEEQISDAEFAAISKLVYRNFGIVLGAEKRSLVVGRLHGCLARRGLASFSDYLRLLSDDRTGEILSELVNHVSTNFTSFFREPAHFDAFAERALPEALGLLKQRRSNDLRIWCAACASGEEAYTIQMVIQKQLGLDAPAFDSGILATDISAKALAIAKAGLYAEEQLESVGEEMRRFAFKRESSGMYRVKEAVRDRVVFGRLNLMNRRFPFNKPFQAIFARNVMIYFDEATRCSLVRKFYDLLEPGGYLFIGHAETIKSEWADLRSVMPAVYHKRR